MCDHTPAQEYYPIYAVVREQGPPRSAFAGFRRLETSNGFRSKAGVLSGVIAMRVHEYPLDISRA
jgi:hypothetical protein